MATVESILDSKGHHVWSVSPDHTVLDALKMMAEQEIGAVLVMDGEKLVGIITERDYARKVVLAGRSSKDAKVKDIMSTGVVCVAPQRWIDECMALMTDKRVRHLPVLDQKRVVGVVSIGDLVKAKIDDQEFTITQLQSYIAGS
jgi:CBS domain-containing protein